MPTIAEFDGIKVLMYYRDHDPPHFHVEYGDCEALIRIADLAVMEGDVPTRVLRQVADWATDRQAGLALNCQMPEPSGSRSSVRAPCRVC